MKHLSTYALSLAVIFLLLTSCASLSVEKRRYRSGYTVHSSHVKSGPSTVQKAKNKTDHSPQESNTLVESQVETNLNLDETNNSVAIPSDRVEEHSFSVEVKTKEMVSNETNSIARTEDAKSQPIQTKSSVKSAIKSSIKSKTIKQSSDSGDDGLSFLGLLVLVVVIIYLLAYFSGGWGLGGAVHLLLVLALILLILWLLGVI